MPPVTVIISRFEGLCLSKYARFPATFRHKKKRTVCFFRVENSDLSTVFQYRGFWPAELAYIRMPALTLALSDVIFPRIGRDTT